MALPSSSSTAALGGMDPTASMGAPPAALGDPASGSGNTVEVTICSTPDGSYMVYAGSPPDSDGGGDGDMSEDDAAAMGPSGDASAAGTAGAGAPGAMPDSSSAGQPADSIGSALKIAMDLLNSSKSSEGAPGNADDQLAAGFSADKAPTAAKGPPMRQKY